MKRRFRFISLLNVKSERFNKIDIPAAWLGQGVFLAGGALRTLIDEQEVVADYDLFFSSQEALYKTLNKLDQCAERVFVCPEGKLYTYKWRGRKIQCIVNDYFTYAVDVIREFDFHACSVVLDWHNKELVISRDFVRNVSLKQLSLARLTFPAATFKRIIKYKEKGYNINRVILEFITALNPEISDENKRFYID